MSSNGTRTPLALAAGLLLAAAPAAAQTASIDTRTGTNMSTYNWLGHYAYSSGYSWANSGGQTFRAPTNGANSLTSFSFGIGAHNDNWYYNNYNAGALSFRAYLVAWDQATSRPTGEILWQSDVQQGSTSPTIWEYNSNGHYTHGGFETRTFNTGGVSLAPGQTYLAFLSSANDLTAPNGTDQYYINTFQLAYTQSTRYDPYYGYSYNVNTGGDYTDGSAVYMYHYNAASGMTGATLADPNATYVYAYGNGDWSYDAAFTAQFGTTDMPEPASLAMLGLGLAGVARTLRRRQRQG
jgi:hypothetical protein